MRGKRKAESIGAGLAIQSERMWMMLRGVISNCSDEEWRSSAGHWFLTPRCLGLHIIYCVDSQGQESPEEWEKCDSLERFGAVWRTREVEKLPGREPMLECVDESRGA